MTTNLNIEAIIGLAITTSILRLDFDSQTRPNEIEIDNSWDDIASQTLEYLKWVGLDTTNIKIDKYAIAQSFWGMDNDQLDEELADE